jgi:UDP-glucuronate 4-epimerase
MRKALITGAAGFIGFHLSKLLLDTGWTVVGFDAITDYYDVQLKYDREHILKQSPNYISVQKRLEDGDVIKDVVKRYQPDVVVHLAAQAGVRFSIDNPSSYLDSNIIGTYKLLEAVRACPVDHLLLASTSSVYGASKDLPFKETGESNHQMSFYAATKKAMEVMAHSYSHLYQIPTTCFRFFTVYGPWGRPDMALFKFVKAILAQQPIHIFNEGNMTRDFTYVDDIVAAIDYLIAKVPHTEKPINDGDSLSAVAPYRIVNIGNSNPIQLMDYISVIEKELDLEAQKVYLPMQAGDVQDTTADTNLLISLTDFRPSIKHQEGIKKFIAWYLNYYATGRS